MTWNNKLIFIVHLAGYFHSCITMHGFMNVKPKLSSITCALCFSKSTWAMFGITTRLRFVCFGYDIVCFVQSYRRFGGACFLHLQDRPVQEECMKCVVQMLAAKHALVLQTAFILGIHTFFLFYWILGVKWRNFI
jgi:hypothetical protein